MSSLIKELSVIPSYYTKECLLTWVASPYDVTIYKSANGITNWIKIATVDPNENNYVDTEYFIKNKVTHYFYKLVDSLGNESNIKNAFNITDLKQNGIINHIVNQELIEMRAGSGIPIAVVSQNTEGEYCPDCVDLDTGQIINSQCDTCNGSHRINGYSIPVKTIVRKINSTKIDSARTETPNRNQEIKYLFRVINIPEFKEGDMFVDLLTDDRYVINALERFDFRGIIPLIVHLNVSLLSRDHPFYNFVIDN